MSEIDDKQKLVNLNDLKYVRAYVDQRVDEKDAANEAFKEQIQRDIPNQVKESVEAEVASQLDAVNAEITNIKNGTTTVAKATDAEHSRTAIVAAYASDDTSKGTIEERLTNLGFKSGSATLSSGTSATLNQLLRQGNYVIFKFEGTPITGANDVAFALPNEFIPNETFETKVSTPGSVTGITLYNTTIGTLYFTKGSPTVRFLYYNYGTGSNFYPVGFQIGYEAEPISTNTDIDDDTTMEV